MSELQQVEHPPADGAPEPHVVAALNYIAPMTEKPWRLTYEPAPGESAGNARYEAHDVPIHDVRALDPAPGLDDAGFALLHAPSALADFDDEQRIEQVYHPESADIVRRAIGASRVVVFDHTIRRHVPGAPRLPVTRVHNDYTETSAPQRVRDLMGDEAETLLRGRFAIVNVWRPIGGPAIDAPLAVADARSVAFEDFVASDLVYRDRVGETYNVNHAPRHRWFYAPAMTPDEVLLLKCYDSATDGRARYTAHSAFLDPTAPADTRPRESIEIRTLAFFD